jgi:hypothetical protein
MRTVATLTCTIRRIGVIHQLFLGTTYTPQLAEIDKMAADLVDLLARLDPGHL